jgi:hypothetical protein
MSATRMTPTAPVPTVGLQRDPRPWSSSLLIGIGFAALAMAFSLYVAGYMHDSKAWAVPGDIWFAVDAGRYVWNGALGHVYQGTQSYALPLSFIVMAPISGLVDHFGLVEGSPAPVPHPSAWLLVGPYSLLFGIFLLHSVMRLAWDLGVRSRLWAVQLLAVVLVLVPGYEWGHFEDVIALTFVLYAARRLLIGDHIRAGLLLSVAISSKQWALPLVPFVVFSAPRGRRLKCLFAACALPVAFVLLVLGSDWGDASKALFSPVNLARQAQGHAAFYVTWLGSRTSQVSRTIGVLIASALAWRMRRVRGSTAILASMAAILVLRPLFEAISYSYYFSPALILAVCVGLAASGQVRWRDWICPLAAIIWATPRGNSASSTWWWAGELILLGITALQVSNQSGVWPGQKASDLLWVKKTRDAPISKEMSTARPAGETTWTQ